MLHKLPPEAPGSPRERFRRQGWDIFIRCRQPDRQYVRAVVDHLREYHGLSIWFDEYSLGEIREVRREIEIARQASRFEAAVAGPSWDERPWRWLAPAELHSKEEGEAWFARQPASLGSITVLLPSFQPSLRQQLFSRMPRPRFRAYGHPWADAVAIVRVYRAYRALRAALLLALMVLLFSGLAWAVGGLLGASLPAVFLPALLWAILAFLAAMIVPLLAWYFYLAWYFGYLTQYLRDQRSSR